MDSTVTTGEEAISGEVGERYARALIELADEAGAFDAVKADMESLSAVLGDAPELRAALSSPIHSAEEKAGVLRALSEKLGLSETSRNFLGVIGRNGRAGDLASAVRAFRKIAAARSGVAAAEVASADALTATQLKELEAALKTALGRDVEIRAEVRPELIGGLVVKVGSRMFDSSLRTKLEGVRRAMKEA
jgi:F-type H+-transporting ATPase subunit delta